MDNKQLRQEIINISEGVIASATDLTLFVIFLGISGLGKTHTSKGAWESWNSAFGSLEEVNYQIIKRALYRLKNKGFVQYTKSGILELPITRHGRERLRSIIPSYDEKRVWDGRIYMVTYDIPEEQKSDREMLRYYLKKIGCGKLQNSVWITPYNPRGVLESFIKQNELKGAAIISEVGDKDSVGEETLKELVSRVYYLDELHGRYLDFNLKYYKVKKFKPEMKLEVIFDFLSILKDDPQLPFSLLPLDWAGKEAYQIFKKATGRKLKQGWQL